jgi:hypothetical protein
MPGGATAFIGEEEFAISPDRPFVFGRADADGVVGLDANDMGISAIAGSVRYESGFWWVVNLSHRCQLLLDDGPVGAPQRLDCGRRHAINAARLSVLVPGMIYTHRILVVVPVSQLACVEPARQSSGTLTAGDIWLSDRDRDALVATYCRYLEDIPRRERVYLSSRQAAELLGPPWTETKLRKQYERFKGNLARTGVYFDGPQAKSQLGEYLVDNAILVPDDLERLSGRS